MIRALIFDLDGTLVQTEKLKALSYARAAVELCPEEISVGEVIEAFKEVVGRSRREVAMTLVERFDLAQQAQLRMEEFGVSTPWQAYVQVRLQYYEEMLSDPQTLRENQWLHNMDLLQQARQANCRVALATMSRCSQAQHVLNVLGLEGAFDVVATRDDVENGKPDPEIYELVATELEVAPVETLVIEDSISGVQAALAAGMHFIAVATPFTRRHLHDSQHLAKRWIVDDPGNLQDVVDEMFDEQGTLSA